MDLGEIWLRSGKSFDNYMMLLEYYGKEDSSLCYYLNLNALELYSGDSYGTICKQEPDWCENSLLEYSIGGTASFNIYNNRMEYKDYLYITKGIKDYLNNC